MLQSIFDDVRRMNKRQVKKFSYLNYYRFLEYIWLFERNDLYNYL